MADRSQRISNDPISRRLNNIHSGPLRRSAVAILRPETSSSMINSDALDSNYDDETLAPVMPAIDAVQLLMEEEEIRTRLSRNKLSRASREGSQKDNPKDSQKSSNLHTVQPLNQGDSPSLTRQNETNPCDKVAHLDEPCTSSAISRSSVMEEQTFRKSILLDTQEEEDFIVRNNPLNNFVNPNDLKRQEDYEFIPKSVILDVYSNDPEVKRFLKQLPRIGTEFGYNEQDYKCFSCRRPIGLVFGESRLCHFDGHHYCHECHLNEKSTIPARILCNWDFNKYPISKRNQHFLTLISNEPMFELKTIAPLLYKTCSELKEILELRSQAFFIRSYCVTCVQDSISFELTKLVWPREHLIKQIDLYSLEDLIQIKSGALKHVLKNIITFGRQHVLSCMLCRQKGFICELCKSSQIIYPFDTESVYRCSSCQSIYHNTCFNSKPSCDACPRCQRLQARRANS